MDAPGRLDGWWTCVAQLGGEGNKLFVDQHPEPSRAVQEQGMNHGLGTTRAVFMRKAEDPLVDILQHECHGQQNIGTSTSCRYDKTANIDEQL